MFRLDDIEEVRVCVTVPDPVIFGAGPSFYPICPKIGGRVALDLRERSFGVVGVVLHVIVAFYGGDEGEKVFFELETDEFFGPDVAHCFGATGIGLVPGIVYSLRYEVYPAAVGY